MNNREAITLLRNLEDSLDSYCELNEEGKTAFRMAIEALNCSEFPNNSDTISRQAAIDELVKMLSDCFYADEEVLDAVKTTLKELPPAQPETATVTIGRTKGSVTMWYECDACGEPVDQKDNYCRNCGRKLKHE